MGLEIAGPGAEQGTLTFVADECRGAGQLGAGLIQPAEPGQQVTPDGGELGVAGEASRRAWGYPQLAG